MSSYPSSSPSIRQMQFFGLSILAILLISAISFGPFSLYGVSNSPNIQSLATTPVATGLVRTWGGTNYDHGQSVAVDSAGNMYLAGTTNSFGAGASDAFVVKYDPTGSITWQRTWGSSQSDSAIGVGVDASGNVYLGGYTYGFNGTTSKVFVLKFDSTGSVQWQRVWGGGSYTTPNAFAVDSSGNSYVTGYTGSAATHSFILKFDPSGTLQWQTAWGTTGETTAGISADSSGNVYVTGCTNTYRIVPAYCSAFILKLNSAGVLQWEKTWGGSNYDNAQSIGTDSSGNVFVAGTTNSFGNQPHTFILKLDPSGNLLWQKVLENIQDPFTGSGGVSIAVNSTGSIFLETFGWGTSLTSAVLVAKIASSGSLVWEVLWGSYDDDNGYGIAVDGSGNAAVTGDVGGPSPYFFSSTSAVYVTSNYNLVTPAGSLTTISLPSLSVSGTVTTPSGSQTYAGSTDAFLLTVPSTGPTNVVRPSSSIQLSIPIQTIITGSTVKISGTITPAVNTTVSLTYIRPDSTTVNHTATSDGSGAFTDTFSPDRSGSWQVRASWNGNFQLSGAQTPLQGLQVQDAPSFLATSLPWLILVAVVVGFGVALVLTKPKAPKMG